MEADSVEVLECRTSEGKLPFREWLLGLRDLSAQIAVEARLRRVRNGNLGNYRVLGAGLGELKIHFGPGYRIYFGWMDAKKILLLLDGSKRKQFSDIATAKRYWKDFKNHEKTLL